MPRRAEYSTGSIDPRGATAVPLVQAKHLRVRYRNGALGVFDVSLRLHDRAIVALFGPNGAGKTTTVRAISGFLRNEGARIVSGSVHLFGSEVTNAEPFRLANRGVAFVPEASKVFPNMTVVENLTAVAKLPSRARRSEVEARIFDLFPILAERKRQAAGSLSGGQQQMLAIARALVRGPRVLIVDELTLGLHPSLHEPLFRAVRAIVDDGTAVLIVDESVAFALEVADYCYILRSGMIQDEGRPERYVGNELLAAGYTGAPS